MTRREVEIYQARYPAHPPYAQPAYPPPAYPPPAYPPVIEQGGYQPAYPHPGYPAPVPTYPHPAYPPPMAPEVPADRLYHVSGVPHIRSASGQLIPLHPPRSHVHRNPVVIGIVGLIALGSLAAGLFVVAYGLMEFVSWGMDHAIKIGAALVCMALCSIPLLKAVGTARHGHPMR